MSKPIAGAITRAVVLEATITLEQAGEALELIAPKRASTIGRAFRPINGHESAPRCTTSEDRNKVAQ
jgi:hypothetical protein